MHSGDIPNNQMLTGQIFRRIQKLFGSLPVIIIATRTHSDHIRISFINIIMPYRCIYKSRITSVSRPLSVAGFHIITGTCRRSQFHPISFFCIFCIFLINPFFFFPFFPFFSCPLFQNFFTFIYRQIYSEYRFVNPLRIASSTMIYSSDSETAVIIKLKAALISVIAGSRPNRTSEILYQCISGFIPVFVKDFFYIRSVKSNNGR